MASSGVEHTTRHLRLGENQPSLDRSALKSRVIVALDVTSRQQAAEVVEALGQTCDFYKVGPVLFYREGPAILEWLRSQKKCIFLDLKAHDIPSVVESATHAAAEMGVTFFTAHVADGSAAAVKASRDAESVVGHKVSVLGVTVLTSTRSSDVQGNSTESSFETLLSSRVEQAVSSGCDGIVAAASDIPLMADLLPQSMLKVCPGIRPRTPRLRTEDDQARTATPSEAAAMGADFIVVGRSVLEASDPLQAFLNIRDEFASLLGTGRTLRSSRTPFDKPTPERQPSELPRPDFRHLKE
ncbi:MAG: orotidine-5'-phosphate decarboxylase [Acidimicrobiia bacterium]